MVTTVTSQQLKRTQADVTISNATTGEYGAIVPCTELQAMERKMKKQKSWDDADAYGAYVSAYIDQLRAPECRKILNKLYHESQAGKTIVFTNHNKGNEHSWSNVLMGLMQGARTECAGPVDYSEYFRVFKQKPDER